MRGVSSRRNRVVDISLYVKKRKQDKQSCFSTTSAGWLQVKSVPDPQLYSHNLISQTKK